MSQRVHLDANVLLRFLRNDDPSQSAIAASLFEEAQNRAVRLIISPVTVSEVFYVFVSVYSMPKPEVARILHTLLASDLVGCEDNGIAVAALDSITSNRDSFGDAYLVATAKQAQEEMASFDKGVTARKDIRAYQFRR